MALQFPKPIRHLIRHDKTSSQSQQKKPINIFQHSPNKNTNKLMFSQSKYHFNIVGDVQFKNKYFTPQKQSNDQSLQLTQRKSLEDTGANSTFNNMTCSIFDGDLCHRLSKTKQLQLTRNQRTFFQFQINKKRQEKIKMHLERRLSYFGTKKVDNTMTFNKKQIQIHENPQLIDLINDNIPEYWKNSLRDNEKRLKRHLKGNTFKREIAEEMLQTLKGRKKLSSSIPHIKQQFISPICSKSNLNYKQKRGFSLKGVPLHYDNLKRQYDDKNKTIGVLPRASFQEVLKIDYNSAYKWRTVQFC